MAELGGGGGGGIKEGVEVLANLHCCQFWLPRKQPVNHKELYNVAVSKQLFHFQTLDKICQVCKT